MQFQGPAHALKEFLQDAFRGEHWNLRARMGGQEEGGTPCRCGGGADIGGFAEEM